MFVAASNSHGSLAAMCGKEEALNGDLRVLDVVALVNDLPALRLRRGQVGTIVELLAPDRYEVEFSDNEGRTYAVAALRTEQLLLLHHEPAPSR